MITTEVDRTLTTQINPAWLDPASYIAFLNRVFPGHWDRTAYDWYAARPFNAIKSDILVRSEGHRVLAGMALCHRQIVVGRGRPIDVRVISAAATLPDERGRGHYGSLLQAAIELCRGRACAALLGFVTRDNGSGRGLTRIGALAIPSFYIVSRDRSRSHRGSRTQFRRSKAAAAADRQSGLDAALAILSRNTGEREASTSALKARFHYERAEDWRRQFIHRPNAVRAIRLAHDSVALIETVRSTDRLQWLGCPHGKVVRNMAALAAASAAAGRDFFMYTLDPLAATAARRAGLGIRGGYLMLQPTRDSSPDWAELAGASWHVQSGDRL